MRSGGDQARVSDRKRVMAIAASATTEELAEPIRRRWPDLQVRDLRSPETGLVMLRGRIGGDGAPFNFGEATVTRAVVELDTGERGFGQVLGRRVEAARLAAIVDALAQRAEDRSALEQSVLEPVRTRIAAERALSQARTAATKVDFFTLVRGEDG